MPLRVEACEWQGKRPGMEDRHVLRQVIGKPGTAVLGAVLDGHGGSQAAEFLAAALRSGLTVNHVIDPKSLLQWLSEVDAAMHTAGMKDVGTTLVAAILRVSDVVLVNVGDSRAIVFSSDGTILAETVDHKPTHPDETRRIVTSGGFVVGGRVNGDLALSRAFGDHRLKPRFPAADDVLVASPDVAILPWTPGSHILLASDGLWDVLSSKEAAVVVAGGGTAADLLRIASSRGTADNVTVVLISQTIQ